MVVVETTLFKGLLHINAAREVAAVHLKYDGNSLCLKIFMYSYYLCMCLKFILIAGSSWRVTQIA